MGIDLDQLNPPQREAVLHRDGPLLVLAGAGSGKTRVVTYRAARLIAQGVSPEAILAVTFTNKAAREMKERLGALLGRSVAKGVTVATFHAFGAQLLRQEIGRLGYRPRFAILDQGDQVALLRRILKELKANPKVFQPESVLERISFARNTGADPERMSRSGNPLLQVAGRALPLYDEARRALNAVDFDDLLLLPLALLRGHEEVRKACQERYHYLMVDEYQDTNVQQLELVRLLAGERSNVCAVGDDDQSIYAWRGARAANILQFERHFPGTRVIALEQNYRSTREILAVANQVIVHNSQRREKTLWTGKSSGKRVPLWESIDEKEEAVRVARDIGYAIRTRERRAADHAILYRINAQSAPFELALNEQRVPFRVVGGTRFFDRKEVRDVIAYLRLLHDPFDEVALLRVINTPPRNIGATTLQRLVDHANRRGIGVWTACCQAASVPDIDPRALAALADFVALIDKYRRRCRDLADPQGLRELLQEVHFYEDLLKQSSSDAQARHRRDNVERLVDGLEQRSRQEDPSLEAFLDMVTLDSRQLEQDEASDDVVTLMTLHSAKGLEFDVVYLVGLEEGLLPFRRADDDSEIAEERRLCYVGVTRARERLVLSYARTRSQSNEKVRRTPSRFLKEIGDKLLERPSQQVETEEERYQRQAEGFAALKALVEEKR